MFAWFWLTACSTSECLVDTASALDATCQCSEAKIGIGGGATAFEDLTAGDDAEIVHGPQGGWHILGSVTAENLSPYLTVHYWIESSAFSTRVSDNTYLVALHQSATCAGTFAGMYGYLDVTSLANGDLDTPPELLSDTELVLNMDVTDLDGRTSNASVAVHAVRSAADEAALEAGDSGDSGDSGD